MSGETDPNQPSSRRLDDEETEPSSLERIRPGDIAVPPGDDLAALERNRLEQDRQNLELRKLEAELADQKQETDLRREYAGKVFKLVSSWLGGVGLLVVAQGATQIPFQLTDTAIAWVIGGTTASVVGLLVTVVAYLFPKREPPNGKSAQRKRPSS